MEDDGDHDGNETKLLDQSEATTALAEAEATRCHRNKKKKTERWRRNHPPFEKLLPELITNIMLYLDDSQDVYNFSKCAKFIRNAVTAQVVVRSAVMAGGKSRHALACIMLHVQNKSIHTPSVLRLLRLVNGKRCERMNSCYGYNLVTKQPQSMPKKSGNLPFGLCICQCCVSGLAQSAFSYHSRFANDPKADVLAKDKLSRIMTQPQSEWSTNDAIGPVVLFDKVKQIQKTYYDDDQKIQALMIIHKDSTSNFDEDFREHVVDLYVQVESEYDSFVDAKNTMLLNKAKAKVADRVNKKKAKVGVILKEIEEALEGCRRKALFLRGSYDVHGYFVLTLGPVRALFGFLLDAPSSATKKKVQAAVTVAKEVSDLLDTRNVGNRFLNNYTFRGGIIAKELFLALKKEEYRSVFVNCVTRVEECSVRNRYCVVAERIWDSCVYTESTLEDHQASLRALKGVYRGVSQNIKDYLQHPSTVAFLALPPSTNERNGYTRQMAVNEVWNFGGYQRTHIYNGNFNDLLSCHKRCYGVGGSIRNLVGE